MRLRVFTPSRVELDEAVDKVAAEGAHGWFTLLPRHVDTVAVLAPGLLAYSAGERGERWLAVEGGTLVKCAGDVFVSTRTALRGSLGDLEAAVEERLRRVDERERRARGAADRMQVDFVRRVLEWEQRRG